MGAAAVVVVALVVVAGTVVIAVGTVVVADHMMPSEGENEWMHDEHVAEVVSSVMRSWSVEGHRVQLVVRQRHQILPILERASVQNLMVKKSHSQGVKMALDAHAVLQSQ